MYSRIHLFVLTFMGLTSAGLFIERSASADIIAKWTFPSTSQLSFPTSGRGTHVSLPYGANQGLGSLVATKNSSHSGSASGTGISASSNSTIPPVDDGTGVLSTYALNNTLVLDFEFATTGYQDIMLSLDAVRVGLDRNRDIGGSLSLDGGVTFVPGTALGSSAVGFGWNHRIGDFSAIDALDNQASVLYRMTVSTSNNVAHNMFLDNITVFGTPLSAVPEPSSLLFVLAAVGSSLRYRSRRTTTLRQQPALR